MLHTIINNALVTVFEGCAIEENLDWKSYQKLKGQKSGGGIADHLGILPGHLHDFEEALKQYLHFGEDPNKSKARLAQLRIGLWLESICKGRDIPFELQSAIQDEDQAFKQLRALELMMRDLISEDAGGGQNVITRLKELFKEATVEGWLQNADETGILSGTTFSELSNILLHKNIFKSVEEIFNDPAFSVAKSTKVTLRLILDDIRRIRNTIAHNKKISNLQVEALNEYYIQISHLIGNSSRTTVNPEAYFTDNASDIEAYVTGIREDNLRIIEGVDQITEAVGVIGADTTAIRKKSRLLLQAIGVAVIGILFLIWQNSSTSSTAQEISGDIKQVGEDMKEVKEIITGDAELRNMASTDDLSVTQKLNERTDSSNVKRLAILYFDNTSGEDRLAGLKKGIADMLITDLSNVAMLDMVERSRLEDLMQEMELSNSAGFDGSTASQVGKLLGAEMILTGAYFEMFGSLRIDARFIDVETGKIVKSDGVEGQTSSFFKIQKQLVWKIIRNLDLKLSNDEKRELEDAENATGVSFDQVVLFSSALDLFDKGDVQGCRVILEEILIASPDFEPASKLLKNCGLES